MLGHFEDWLCLVKRAQLAFFHKAVLCLLALGRVHLDLAGAQRGTDGKSRFGTTGVCSLCIRMLFCVSEDKFQSSLQSSIL